MDVSEKNLLGTFLLVSCQMQLTKQRMKFTTHRKQRKNKLTSGSNPTRTLKARDGEAHCFELIVLQQSVIVVTCKRTPSHILWICCGVRDNLFNYFFREHFLPDIGHDILNGGRVQLVVRAIFLSFCTWTVH